MRSARGHEHDLRAGNAPLIQENAHLMVWDLFVCEPLTDASEKPFPVTLGQAIALPGELLKQLASVGGKPGGYPDGDPHQLVSATASLQQRYPFVAHAEDFTALCAGCNLQHGLTGERGHFHVGAEGGL